MPQRTYLGLALATFALIGSIVIAGFKLLVYPDLSWWLVLCPLWLPILMATLGISLMLVLSIICLAIEHHSTDKHPDNMDIAKLEDSTVIDDR